jgi:hypothetical protein
MMGQHCATDPLSERSSRGALFTKEEGWLPELPLPGWSIHRKPCMCPLDVNLQGKDGSCSPQIVKTSA